LTRLLVVSDTHGEKRLLERILEQAAGGYDAVIHLGDGYRDALDFKKDIRELHLVAGNMDNVFDPAREIPEILVIELEGVKVLLTHGHKFRVHSTTEELERYARLNGAALVLYGHTHEKELVTKDGIVFFNPGAAKHGFYGKIELEKGKPVKAEHFRVI
jgi:putative phosphoesterase